MPYKNTRFVQYYDSATNREKQMITTDIDNIGTVEIDSYVHYETRSVVTKVPAFGKCNTTGITTPQFHSVADMIKRIQDPSEGFTTYLGVNRLAWVRGALSFNTYQLTLLINGKNFV